MIVIESSWWPLVVVGHLPDRAAGEFRQAPSGAAPGAAEGDEAWLEFGHDLRLALVVAGVGERAVAAQFDVLTWLKRCDAVLSRRTCRLAWVVEDAAFRAAVESWLTRTPRPLMDVPSATFDTIAAAIRWLIGFPADVDPPAPPTPTRQSTPGIA